MTSTKSLAAKTAALLVLTGSLLFTASCGESSSAADGYVTATPDGNDYSYTYPDVWEVIRSDSMFAIQSPDKAANISSSCYAVSLEDYDLEIYASEKDPYSALLDDYVNRPDTGYIDLMKDNFGENVELISAEDCMVGERTGKKLVYHIKVGEDDYYFATVLTLLPTVGSTYLYDLTYTAQNETAFNEHLAVFDSAVASFIFR